MMQLKFKLLSERAQFPKRATSGSAGLDLTVAWYEVLDDGIKYHSDVAFEIPKGYVGLLFSRSSVHKTGQSMANSVGVIDSDYRGEVSAVMYHTFVWSDKYNVGDRFAQLVVVPVADVELVETDELSKTERGSGGYGSTGK